MTALRAHLIRAGGTSQAWLRSAHPTRSLPPKGSGKASPGTSPGRTRQHETTRRQYAAKVLLREDERSVGDLVRAVRTKRSSKQFARGQRGGILTTLMQASAMTASNDAANCPGVVADEEPESGEVLIEVHD